MISIVLTFWRQPLKYLWSFDQDSTPPLYCHFECLRSTDELVSWPKRWCRAADRAVSWAGARTQKTDDDCDRRRPGGTRSFGLSLSSGGPIWPARQPVAGVQRTGVGLPGLTPPEARLAPARAVEKEWLHLPSSSLKVTLSKQPLLHTVSHPPNTHLLL